MKKAITTLTVPQTRQRLRYENAVLHKLEAANHALYLEHGQNWSGHAHGVELDQITEHVRAAMDEAGEAAYNAGKAAGVKFRKRRIAIITARNDARVTVAARHDLKELTEKITAMFRPTEHHKLFPNPIPEPKDGTYNAKALRKWCARTTRVAMLVAEQYVDTHIEVGGQHIQEFHRVSKETEKIHETVHKLREHIRILKTTAPPPVYLPPPGWVPQPGWHAPYNWNYPPPPPAAHRRAKRHSARPARAT
jgi:hypothetical protein